MTAGRTESSAVPEPCEDLSATDRVARQADATRQTDAASQADSTRQTDDQPAGAAADDESDPEDPSSPPRFP